MNELSSPERAAPLQKTPATETEFICVSDGRMDVCCLPAVMWVVVAAQPRGIRHFHSKLCGSIIVEVSPRHGYPLSGLQIIMYTRKFMLPEHVSNMYNCLIIKGFFFSKFI